MLFSFVVVVVVFVVMQMIVWYASKSIQNIILNENYIINKSIVVINSLRSRPGAPFFLRAKEEITRTRYDRRLLRRLSTV